jgi:DNA-binding IclR family transcriptional regulator
MQAPFDKTAPNMPSGPLNLSGPARRRRGPGQGRAAPEFIEALARGLDVLRCFGPQTGTLGNQDLATLTGLPKPTISRITYTLTELGYLRYHPESGKYSPGFGVLALGFGVLAGLEVRTLARECMQQLAKDTGGAIALGAFDGDAMVYVEAIHGSSDLYLRLPVGYRASLNSAMGRAYLAALPEAQRSLLLDRLGDAAPSDAVVNQAINDYAETACCFALGTWRPDINAVAMPFESVTGEGTFVMSCGGPATLLSADVLRERVAPALRQVAQQLSGYRR